MSSAAKRVRAWLDDWKLTKPTDTRAQRAFEIALEELEDDCLPYDAAQCGHCQAIERMADVLEGRE